MLLLLNTDVKNKNRHPVSKKSRSLTNIGFPISQKRVINKEFIKTSQEFMTFYYLQEKN